MRSHTIHRKCGDLGVGVFGIAIAHIVNQMSSKQQSPYIEKVKNASTSLTLTKQVKANHFTKRIQILLSNNVIRKVCDTLFKDSTFQDRIRENVDLILEDGKVDHNDVMPLVLLVLDIVSEITNVRGNVTTSDFADLIKCIVYHIIDKYMLSDNQSTMLAKGELTSFCAMVDKHLDVALRLALNGVAGEIHKRGLGVCLKHYLCGCCC